MSKQVRVLVVDDSAFYRKRIRRALEASPAIRVIGEAADGSEACRLNRALEPDLVTMDVAMPVMDGIEAVRRIMRERPTRVVMFSALTREGARATLEALDAGAVDFLPKVDPSVDPARAGELLRERVLGLAGEVAPAVAPPAQRARPAVRGRRPELLVIGASTGGPIAVQQVLESLPGDFPVPVLVAIHMPGSFTPTYAERLDQSCALEVREARDGDSLAPGRVLVAPGGRQTRIDGGPGLRVAVGDGGDLLYRPSVDLAFESAARRPGPGTLALVLTGMGADGAEGARAVRDAGGRVWAQDRESSVVWGMPQAVTRAGVAERVLALSEIAPALREVASWTP